MKRGESLKRSWCVRSVMVTVEGRRSGRDTKLATPLPGSPAAGSVVAVEPEGSGAGAVLGPEPRGHVAGRTADAERYGEAAGRARSELPPAEAAGGLARTLALWRALESPRALGAVRLAQHVLWIPDVGHERLTANGLEVPITFPAALSASTLNSPAPLETLIAVSNLVFGICPTTVVEPEPASASTFQRFTCVAPFQLA